MTPSYDVCTDKDTMKNDVAVLLKSIVAELLPDIHTLKNQATENKSKLESVSENLKLQLS